MEHQQLQVTLRRVGSIRLATGDGSNRWEFGYCAKGGRQLCEGAHAPCIAAGYSCIAASFATLRVYTGHVESDQLRVYTGHVESDQHVQP